MVKKICEVPGCSKEGYCQDLCRSHYYRLRTYGSATAPNTRETKLCEYPDCNEKHLAHGWCVNHYAYYFRRGGGVTAKQWLARNRRRLARSGSSS